MAQCKATCKATRERCNKAATPGFEVCAVHGSRAAKKNLKHGKYSAVQIRTRAAFLEALAGDDAGRAREYVDKVHELAIKGSEPMLRYALDQMFGAPKTTVVTEIGDRDLFATFVRVTARYLTGENFTQWLSELKAAMGDPSPSTS